MASDEFAAIQAALDIVVAALARVVPGFVAVLDDEARQTLWNSDESVEKQAALALATFIHNLPVSAPSAKR